MIEFECSICGDTNLYLVRKETNSTELFFNDESIDFDYGRESVVDCDVSVVQCGNGHTLKLKNGSCVEEFKEFKIWLTEQVEVKKEQKEAEKAEIKERKCNPFALYYIGDYTGPDKTPENVKKAKKVSKRITVIVDKMASDIIDKGKTKCKIIMKPVSAEIVAFQDAGVGVGDTATDTIICTYFENNLKSTFDKKAIDKMSYIFYDMIHV